MISKATEGQTYVAPTLDSFVKNCEKRKIPYWLYTFLRDGNELAQAKFRVKTCKNKIGKYFVGYILDIEQNNAQSNCQKALDYISGQGYKTMVYTMYAQYTLYKTLVNDRPKDCAWWEARYGLNDGVYRAKYPCHPGVDLHQYTSSGRCPGISDRIDLNRLTGRKAESWFTTRKTAKRKEKKGYPGTFPALPPRGYYQTEDGYKTLENYTTQIKRVQKKFGLLVNGKFGKLTLENGEEDEKIGAKKGQTVTKKCNEQPGFKPPKRHK